MESARLPVHSLPTRRANVALIGALLLLAAIGWAVTDERMQGMDAGPGTDPGAFGFYVGVWVVMMAAMMFPSIAPMVLAFAGIQERERDRGRALPLGTTALFVGGYLVVWTFVGVLAWAILELGRSLSIDALGWDSAGPYVAGGVIAAAGIYQLTRLKDACLRRCRDPHGFLTDSWRPGHIGALRMGIEHGGYCVGCCWALMAALFALGVMSIGWMVFIAALIAIEKLLPWKPLANRGIAVLLIALGIAVAFVPEEVPGLTLPDSAEAHSAMESMGMEEGGGSMEMEEAGSMEEGGSMAPAPAEPMGDGMK